jgi:cobalt-zinc-cadmium efflux system protein
VLARVGEQLGGDERGVVCQVGVAAEARNMRLDEYPTGSGGIAAVVEVKTSPAEVVAFIAIRSRCPRNFRGHYEEFGTRRDDSLTQRARDTGGVDGSGERDARLLAAAAGLIVAFLAGEVVAAILASSLALLADAGHMLTDALALLLAVGALQLARRPATGRWTFGLARAEVLSAAVNGITLLVVGAVVLVEAVRRLLHPTSVDGSTVVVVAAIGLAVNIVASMLLARADRASLNITGALAHVVTDAYAFAATLIAGIVIVATGFRRADPIASLFVVTLILRASIGLLRDSGRVLLESAPEHVDLAELRSHLLETTHVVAVHDLHVWTSGSSLPTVSAHVVVQDECFTDGHSPQILDALQECLVGHFDVEHSTFQLEPVTHAAHESGAH